ncbi:MAG TPA: hypothetical protein VK627_09690 [Edaphobacter sp.]|nr:hypothetical protein [Edaphobacter sp.]
MKTTATHFVGYTGFAYSLPMVGMTILFCDQREPRPEGGIQVTK